MSTTNEMNDSSKLKLLLSCLRITCRYFAGDEQVCGLSELGDFETCHIACNCDGDINECDLPDKFQVSL